jgi:predicted ABC-type ATPase
MGRGGQAAPVSSVIASYRESTNNLLKVRKHADELIVFDNTAHDGGHRVVAHFTNGELTKAAQTCFRQLDLAPFDRLIWPHLLVNLS